MEVRKSEGYFEEYNPSKVKHGICEAYVSVNEVCPDGLIESLIKNLFIYDKISSKEIRRQVEEALMSVNKKVARAYIKKYSERVKFLYNQSGAIFLIEIVLIGLDVSKQESSKSLYKKV